ncbi:unnamed protein product [Protopolystoma xenopodis]|uniref:Uncharacterized protein n=1 Tax=Protopolystoma xenopodis TaxID=117903 RepID=A0A3S5FDY1_9PLAT|nr:unnamed protein product [Protopolystoma xenopodis]
MVRSGLTTCVRTCVQASRAATEVGPPCARLSSAWLSRAWLSRARAVIACASLLFSRFASLVALNADLTWRHCYRRKLRLLPPSPSLSPACRRGVGFGSTAVQTLFTCPSSVYGRLVSLLTACYLQQTTGPVASAPDRLAPTHIHTRAEGTSLHGAAQLSPFRRPPVESSSMPEVGMTTQSGASCPTLCAPLPAPSSPDSTSLPTPPSSPLPCPPSRPSPSRFLRSYVCSYACFVLSSYSALLLRSSSAVVQRTTQAPRRPTRPRRPPAVFVYLLLFQLLLFLPPVDHASLLCIVCPIVGWCILTGNFKSVRISLLAGSEEGAGEARAKTTPGLFFLFWLVVCSSSLCLLPPSSGGCSRAGLLACTAGANPILPLLHPPPGPDITDVLLPGDSAEVTNRCVDANGTLHGLFSTWYGAPNCSCNCQPAGMMAVSVCEPGCVDVAAGADAGPGGRSKSDERRGLVGSESPSAPEKEIKVPGPGFQNEQADVKSHEKPSRPLLNDIAEKDWPRGWKKTDPHSDLVERPEVVDNEAERRANREMNDANVLPERSGEKPFVSEGPYQREPAEKSE